MNFILKPSLERIALVKVAALLWNQPDIRALVTEFSNSPFPHLNPFIYSFNDCSERGDSKWPKIQDKVIEKTAHLILPASLKEKLIGYVQMVGKQISKWIEYYIKFCCFDLDVPNEFCWTSQGTIDKKKTAEMLIRVDGIDIITRYKLACFHCLEDDIPELWNKVLPESQREFRHTMYDVVSMTDIKKICVTKIVAFWTHGITVLNNRHYGSSTYRDLLRFAAKCGNKVAAEYSLQKFDLKEFLLNTAINVAENLRCLTTETVPKENSSEVLCFLISQMSTDQQVKLFQQCPYQVLCCLLDWPFQNLFVETAKLLWDFLPKSCYHLILLKIIDKEFFGYKDYNYKKVFRDVWQEIPDADKSFIINHNRSIVVLYHLMRVKDTENFKVIFQRATPVEKNKFMFSARGFYFCKKLVYHEEWDLVKFFVQFLISSKNEMIQFKQEIQERVQARIALHQIINNSEATNCWDEFFRILDDFIRGYDKRGVDEGETSSGKRLCNVEVKDMMCGAEKLK